MGKGKEPEQALEIFKDMQQHGIARNAITYSALIRACQKSRAGIAALIIAVAWWALLIGPLPFVHGVHVDAWHGCAVSMGTARCMK